MRALPLWCLSLIVLAPLSSVHGLRAAERQIVLREHFGQKWMNELVTYPFTAKEGACRADSLTLTGPNGALPVQLSGVEYWPGSQWVKSARLSFLADLDPLSATTYTVRYGEVPAAGPVPASDLRVTPGQGMVEVSTSKNAIRLLRGEKVFTPPAAAPEVPGPVVAMRLADGTWFGGSRMYGPARIKAYRAASYDGPVFGGTRVRYEYADGRTLDIDIRLAAGHSRIYWTMKVAPHDPQEAVRLVLQPGFAEGISIAERIMPKDGWRLLLNPNLPGLRFEWRPESTQKWNPWGKRGERGPVHVEVDREPAGVITALVPWSDAWDGRTQLRWLFSTAERGNIFQFVGRDAGAWVEPAPLGTRACWGNPRMRQKWVYLVKGDDGVVAAQFNLASGVRKWVMDTAGPDDSMQVEMGGFEKGFEPFSTLDEVKDFVLDWPSDPKVTFPHLYMTARELQEARKRQPDDAELIKRYGVNWRDFLQFPHSSDWNALGLYLMSGTKEMAEKTRVVERLRRHLRSMGNYDRMRHVPIPVSLYDALMGTDLVSEEEKKELRARMAFLGYLMASADAWSMERGYCSGNENMSVCYVFNLGLIGCLLRDHPMAEEWVRPGLALAEKSLRQNVGVAGEWPESVCNYAHVSVSSLLPFAIAARNAGFHDYVSDPRMKKLLLYLAKQYTPPDSRSGGQRRAGLSGTAPIGRAGAGAQWGLAGVMARAIQHDDPQYCRYMQWSWMQTGFSRNLEYKMGGYEYVYADETLPWELPQWGFDCFPEVGTIMRYGIGTEDEYYINFMINYSFGYPSESGAFPCIWARGVPISSRFAGGYIEREELLMSRVLPARRRGTFEERQRCFYHEGRRRITEFSTLPRQDYVVADLTMEETDFVGHRGKELPEWPPVPREAGLPIQWRRQILFVKDARPAGANYLVLRDTVGGGQPTMWQFWTISEKIGTPRQVRDLQGFLADKPGNKMVEPRELKGNRFTAIGQFGVDVEYYIASPADTPRYTLRWGTTYHYSPIGGFTEYQDMLHLQMGGDGAYFVALFPRRRSEPVPQFESLGGGKVIKVTGEFGTDYCFLSGTRSECSAGDASFEGTVASVQDRPGGLVLSLGSEGRVSYRDYALESDQAVSLHVGPDVLCVRSQDDFPGALVRFTAPGDWTVDTGTGTQIFRRGQVYRLKIGPNRPELKLYRE